MTASELFDLVKTTLEDEAVLAGWKILAHTARDPADKQVDMTLGPAPVGALYHGTEWIQERLHVRFSRAISGYQNLGLAHRELADLRDPLSMALLGALGNHNELMLFPQGLQPQWDEVAVTMDSSSQGNPYLVLELEIPLERRLDIGG